MNFIIVGLGGGIGAVLRYIISLIPFKTAFPLLTLATNFLGAFLIGIAAGAAEMKDIKSSTMLFFKTGVCGGFTTFSTFSLETVTLFEDGRIYMGAFYIAASVCLCLAGVLVGKLLIKAVL